MSGTSSARAELGGAFATVARPRRGRAIRPRMISTNMLDFVSSGRRAHHWRAPEPELLRADSARADRGKLLVIFVSTGISFLLESEWQRTCPAVESRHGVVTARRRKMSVA